MKMNLTIFAAVLFNNFLMKDVLRFIPKKYKTAQLLVNYEICKKMVTN